MRSARGGVLRREAGAGRAGGGDRRRQGTRTVGGLRVALRAMPSVVPVLLVLLAGAVGDAAGQGARGGSAPAAGDPDATCIRCHSLANLGYREAAGGPVQRFTVTPEVFAASAHGRLSCRQCHTDIDSFPHPAGSAAHRVSCDQDCHAVDASGRPYTHRSIVAAFAESVHGRERPSAASGGAAEPGTAPGGVAAHGTVATAAGAGSAGADADADRPTCLTCHGSGDAHAIVPVAKQTRASKMAACVTCHDDRAMMERHGVTPDAVTSYRRSFHYKGVRFGASGTAICVDCHTAHHVLPPDDPRSSVAPAALTKTCGQSNCHEGAGRNFAVSGANHLDLRVERSGVLWFEEKFFLVLTAGTMLMLLVGIVLDVQRKFGWGVLLSRAGRAVVGRMRTCRPAWVRAGRRGLVLARRILID